MCATVREDGCAFVTNNGKIDCMMIDLSMFDTINEAIHSYDQWVAQHELGTHVAEERGEHHHAGRH